MRGTSMYYEEAKKNVMALLRQNGSPSLFLTLSCAEYSWNGLLREIIETVRNERISDEFINNLSAKEKNKYISENVVQSTLYFQKKFEKELKMTMMGNFLISDCPYSASSYYYRIEFQQRGAPHVHCLIWLQDENGKAAPTFWTADDSEHNIEEKEDNDEEKKQKQKNDQILKMEKIENIADMLISTSVSSALCDQHQKESKLSKCLACFSVENNFEPCKDHLSVESNNECIECQKLKEMAEKFQTHKHTFTCEWKV